MDIWKKPEIKPLKKALVSDKYLFDMYRALYYGGKKPKKGFEYWENRFREHCLLEHRLRLQSAKIYSDIT
jgi:hypothetical protein